MKKYKNLIIIFIIFIVAIVAIRYITETPTSTKIVNYLIKNGYRKEEDLLSKTISNLNYNDYQYYSSKNIPATTEINHFSIDNYQLTKIIDNYQDKIMTNLAETYDYTDDSLFYTYRITGNNINIIYKGEFNKESNTVTCQQDFSYGVDATNLENVICENMNLEIKKFTLEAKLLFKNADFINYMKKQKK